MFKKMSLWLGIFSMLFAFTAVQADQYGPGKGYTLIEEPVTVMADGKVHVEIAFWYGCPHCFKLESLTNSWSQTLASDVALSKVPAQFGRPWVAHAQLFYTAQALGALEKTHDDIFKSYHMNRKPLLSQSDQRRFMMDKVGITAAEFDKAYNSFTVKSRMKQADQRINAFGINGVPAVIVQGKYVVDAGSAGGQNNILNVVDFLIEKERQALK